MPKGPCMKNICEDLKGGVALTVDGSILPILVVVS